MFIRRFSAVAVILTATALALAACTRIPESIESSSSATIHDAATTTTQTTTTTTPITAWERPSICDCPDETVSAVPVGPNGVTYTHFQEAEIQAVGPAAIAVGRHDDLLILDTAGDSLVSASGDTYRQTALHWDRIGSLLDVVAAPEGYVVLEVTGRSSRLVSIQEGGIVTDVVDLPEGLRLDKGLSGIDLSPDGAIWVELEGGNQVAELDIDTMDYVLHHGYPFPGGLYRSLTSFEPTTVFQAGDVTVEVENRSGGQMTSQLIGVNPDNSFVIQVTELTQDDDGLITATTQARWYGEAGELIATAELPLEDQLIFVDHPVVLDDDGYLYYLVPRENEVQIRKLGWHSPTE